MTSIRRCKSLLSSRFSFLLLFINHFIIFYHVESFSVTNNNNNNNNNGRQHPTLTDNQSSSRTDSQIRSKNIDVDDANASSTSRPTSTTITTRTGPKAESSRSTSTDTTRKRRNTTQSNEIIFDPKELTKLQISNENSNLFNLISSTSSLTMKSATDIQNIVNFVSAVATNNNNIDNDNIDQTQQQQNNNDIPIHGPSIKHSHIEYLSLDELFPNLNFSNHFHKNGKFREAIRQAMRKDIFYTTPAFTNLSPKVASYMLDDDSSLQGSWNCIPSSSSSSSSRDNDDKDDKDDNKTSRMDRLTSVLRDYLGEDAPSGDEFMMKIGSLCGKNPSTHWIDIIGVKNRLVSHSWHQDSGRSYDDDNIVIDDFDIQAILNNESRYTVMLGFPQEDEYEGTGVFSHAIKLTHECLAPNEHNVNEPVLFQGTVDEQFIVRPHFSLGKEIIKYRDVDVLHSAPDVVYRKSVMRFM